MFLMLQVATQLKPETEKLEEHQGKKMYLPQNKQQLMCICRIIIWKWADGQEEAWNPNYDTKNGRLYILYSNQDEISHSLIYVVCRLSQWWWGDKSVAGLKMWLNHNVFIILQGH